MRPARTSDLGRSTTQWLFVAIRMPCSAHGESQFVAARKTQPVDPFAAIKCYVGRSIAVRVSWRSGQGPLAVVTHQDHHWISVQAACRPECPSSCCAPLALLRGGSRVARTAPRQVATLTSGPCHVRCYCAPRPPATAPARPPVQVAHPLPPALHERKGNHAHNGQETTNGAQQRRQPHR